MAAEVTESPEQCSKSECRDTALLLPSGGPATPPPPPQGSILVQSSFWLGVLLFSVLQRYLLSPCCPRKLWQALRGQPQLRARGRQTDRLFVGWAGRREIGQKPEKRERLSGPRSSGFTVAASGPGNGRLPDCSSGFPAGSEMRHGCRGGRKSFALSSQFGSTRVTRVSDLIISTGPGREAQCLARLLGQGEGHGALATLAVTGLSGLVHGDPACLHQLRLWPSHHYSLP